MTTYLVTKHPRWTKKDWAIYAGTPVEVMDEQDVKGQTLVRLLAGPLVNSTIWVADDEIEQVAELAGLPAREG